MRIIQVMPEFGLAGAEIMCENLLHEYKKRGHELFAISLYDYHSAITDRLENDGIRIYYLDKKPGLDFSIFFKINRILKEIKPDVIHTHRYVIKYVLPGTVKNHIKSRVHTVHSLAEKENFTRDRFFYRIAYKMLNFIPVALNDEVRDSISRVYRISRDKIPVIYNGIEMSNAKCKSNYFINGMCKILHVGRFADEKNHSEIIKAMKRITEEDKKIKLKLIGEGPLFERIVEQVNKLELNDYIEFVGTTDDVRSYMLESDFFILPSVYEGMPMTLIEAMSLGIPIIASNVGGIPSLIKNGYTGILCEPNEESIYNSVSQLIKDEELRKRIGQNAFKESRQYSSSVMAERYESIYLR